MSGDDLGTCVRFLPETDSYCLDNASAVRKVYSYGIHYEIVLCENHIREFNKIAKERRTLTATPNKGE